MNVISSKDNETIKNIKKIKRKKRYRDLENVYIVEGIKMVKRGYFREGFY